MHAGTISSKYMFFKYWYIYIYIYIRGGSRLVPLVSGNQSEIWKKERKNYILCLLLVNLILLLYFVIDFPSFYCARQLYPPFNLFPWVLYPVADIYIYIYSSQVRQPTKIKKISSYFIKYILVCNAASHWFPCVAPLVLMEHGNLKRSIGEKKL